MADKSEQMTENAVAKAMAPSLASLKNIESGISKLNQISSQGAEERIEGARAEKKEAKKAEKTNTLLEGIMKSIGDLNKTMLETVKDKIKSGLGNLLAGVIAPILIMVGFFAQLKAEFAMLKTLTGGGLTKLFAPLKNLLTGKGKIASAIKKSLKFIDKMHGGIFSKIGNFFKNFGQNKAVVKVSETITKVKGSMSQGLMKIKNFFQPISDFFKSFQKVKPFGPPKPGLLTKGIRTIKNIITVIGDIFKPIIRIAKTIFGFVKTGTAIGKWAIGFGRILGKLFLPITILMSAFDFITGFLDGFKEDGIMGGLEGGLSKLLKGLIGMPLDLLKDGVSWILGKFGFEQASETLDAFSFSTLIDKMVKGFFDAVDGIVGWLGDKFSFSTIGEALTSMLNLIWMPAVLFKEWLITPLVNWIGGFLEVPPEKLKAITDFDILGTIGNALDNIIDFFKGIFDIDWSSAIKNVAPKWVKDVPIIGKWFGGGDKPDDGAAAAQKKKEAEELAAIEKKKHEEKIKQAKELAARQAEAEKKRKEEAAAKLKAIQVKADKGESTWYAPSTWFATKKDEEDEAPKSKSDAQKGGGTGGSAVKVSPKKVDLKGIDWDFISKKEGGSKTDGYVPNPEGSKSGVTIATGFDLGARNAKDLKGLPLSLKEKLSPYLGLQGMVASEYLETRPLTVTASEAKLIDKKSKGGAVKKLKAEWNKNAAIMKTPMFEDLTGAQQTVAASVAFQYGSLAKAPKFRAAAQEGRWDDVQGELRNFGDDYASRRTSEADYLMANRPNNSGSTLNELEVANAEGKAGANAPSMVNAPNTNNTNMNESNYHVQPVTAQNSKAGALYDKG